MSRSSGLEVYIMVALSNDIRNGSIPRWKRCIVAGEPAVPICVLENPAYPLLPCLMIEFANGGKTRLKNYLVFACPWHGW